MKKIRFICVFIVAILMVSCFKKPENELSGPNGNIKVKVYLNNQGEINFDVFQNNEKILIESKLGLIREDQDFSKKMNLLAIENTESVSDNYSMLYGKKKNITYNANKKVYHFENTDKSKMDIIFQISDDGLAFRYYFPEKSVDIKTIEQEITTYCFPEKTKTWIQPIAKAKSGWKRTNPSYEEFYDQEVEINKLRYHEPGWIYPALFKTESTWLCISETAPYRDYCGTRLLHTDSTYSLSVGFPSQRETLNEKEGALPNSNLPWYTPWRVIAIGNNLATIAESTLGTDLAKPNVLDDISFVKPGRASWSWVMLKDDSTIFPVQKRFVDYSSTMGWEYCLVDADWNMKIGYEKIKELADYAESKNVGLILWYNSAGSWNDAPYRPRDKMLTKESREKEFSLLKEMGIKGVKVDFFGGDGQDVMSYYLDIFEAAAKHHIMVNTHGCTLPRGWNRTYPNLVNMEAIRGEEFCTFMQETTDLQPTHCCMLPFTRNVFDPMDFTPVRFGEIPYRNRVTTNSFELALSVLFMAGVQHYAETDIDMYKAPDFIQQYMRDIPVSWDDSKFIDGYPGKLVIMARRTGNTWYVAGINGENIEKTINIDLSFINTCDGEYISDVNSREVQLQRIQLPENKNTEINFLPNGGIVMKFVEL